MYRDARSFLLTSLRFLLGVGLPLVVGGALLHGVAVVVRDRLLAQGLRRLALFAVRDTLLIDTGLFALGWIGASLAGAAIALLSRRFQKGPRRFGLLASVAAVWTLPSAYLFLWANRTPWMARARSTLGLLENAGLLILVVLICVSTYRLARRFSLSWRGPTRRRLASGFVSSALFLAALTGASVVVDRPAGGDLPNLIFILIDTLRPDHLGCYGYGRPTSATLDALSAESVLFEEAVSASSWTRSSIATLFTSTLPSTNGVMRADAVLRRNRLTLPELLREAGYRTVGFNANVTISDKFGFDQGFDLFETAGRERAETITNLALEWIEENSEKRPFFLYLHYLDPHAPFDAPSPFGGMFEEFYEGTVGDRYYPDLMVGDTMKRQLDESDVTHLRDLYDGEIRYLDSHLHRLVNELKRLGLTDTSWIIVASDHGEEFLEHGRLGHNTTLYDEVLRVPLLIHLPGAKYGGRRIAAQVGLIDLAPTLLEVAAVNVPQRMRGQSLRNWLETGEDLPHPNRPIRSELGYSLSRPERTPILWQSARTPEAKAILTFDLERGVFREEVFDLLRDPLETTPLAPGPRLDSLLVRLEGAMPERGALATRVLQSGPGREIDPETRRQLRALGYLQ
jgi:arylsulfatase A-like enzyme